MKMEMTKTKELVNKTIEIMENKKGTGLRYNKGKLRYDLVQADAHRDMVDILTMGSKKYADRNWENGMDWSIVIASMKRHIAAIELGQDYDFDPDCEGCQNGECTNHSGKLHIAHVACNAHFLNAYYYIYPQGDNRPKKWKNMPKIGLDIDEVLADWVGTWRKEFNIKNVPTSWFFDRNIKARFEELREAGKLDELYLKIKPLLKPEDIPFEPHCYITSRPVDASVSEEWLDMHGFPTKPVYCVGNEQTKVDVAKEAGVEIFIDDSYRNFEELNNNGIFCYLYDQPHNQRYDVGHMRIKSLRELPFLK